MLEAVGAVLGLVELLLVWRFVLGFAAGVVFGWFAVEWLPPGIPRVIVFLVLLLAGSVLGWRWHQNHERRRRE
jgi:uncharacterized membrane protein YfcA